MFREVDGERRIAGEETVRFDTEESVGAYANAAVYLDRSGRVELGLETGTRDTATVRFVREF